MKLRNTLSHLRAISRALTQRPGWATLSYAARYARRCIDLYEHQHGRVQAELERRRLANVRYELIEPTVDAGFKRDGIADPAAYVSDDEQYAGKTFKAYAQAICAFPDSYFDLVVVDGRARPSCILNARDKVRPGGVLLLDQSERPYYLETSSALLDPARWSRTRYMAPLPYSLHFTEATFFTRRHT